MMSAEALVGATSRGGAAGRTNIVGGSQPSSTTGVTECPNVMHDMRSVFAFVRASDIAALCVCDVPETRYVVMVMPFVHVNLA
jgi:hypothetical protein